jgi:methylenetetrahydrofolate dehydrogenase (NADP+) / methenyltetrahydrofolate cyclohydrolase
MQLLDGRKAREYYVSIIIERIKKLPVTPCLVIIQVGDRLDSDAFIKAKKSFAKKIGAKEIHEKFPINVSEEEIIKLIKKYNEDSDVHGIIVQLPLPDHLNRDQIINTIKVEKDTDGLRDFTKTMPATARGVKELLGFYNISIKGKKVTVMGRSKLVGGPIAKMIEEEGGIVTVCHKHSENNEEKSRSAEILIVAIGDPKFINEKYVNKDQIVIDVGITREGERLVGDVDFEKVKDIVKMITPVPGGVGQMTVLALFENLVDACYNAE